MSSNLIELDEVQTMYRAVVSDAVRDLGFGTKASAWDVRKWMNSGAKFTAVCHLANWEETWVREVMHGVIRIDSDVRKAVVLECLEIMRGIVRVSAKDRNDSCPVMLTADARSSVADEGRMSYAGAPIGKLSKASNDLHRRRAANDSE
jgi:hypothetical protein